MEKNNNIEPKPIGVGYFGNVYDQFRGKVKEAFDFLVAHQSGDLIGVFQNLRDKATGGLIDDKKKWVVTSYDNNVPKSDKLSASTLTTPESDEGGRAVASDAIS
jgi:hypothetical protein